MKTTKQLEIEQDFLVAMTELVIAITNICHKIDNFEVFLSSYRSTLERLEGKIDQIHSQTIRIDTVKDGVEDYGK